MLRAVEGLPAGEICKILEVSATHYGVLMHRARIRLRNCLELKGWRKSGSRAKTFPGFWLRMRWSSSDGEDACNSGCISSCANCARISPGRSGRCAAPRARQARCTSRTEPWKRASSANCPAPRSCSVPCPSQWLEHTQQDGTRCRRPPVHHCPLPPIGRRHSRRGKQRERPSSPRGFLRREGAASVSERTSPAPSNPFPLAHGPRFPRRSRGRSREREREARPIPCWTSPRSPLLPAVWARLAGSAIHTRFSTHSDSSTTWAPPGSLM